MADLGPFRVTVKPGGAVQSALDVRTSTVPLTEGD